MIMIKDKEVKDLYKSLFTLVIPIALQNLMNSFVSASDAIMLGFLEQDSLSAVSLATQVAFILGLFHAAFSTGATLLVAQYYGKNDHDTIEEVLAIAMRYMIIVSFIFFMCTLTVPQVIMRAFTADPVLIEKGAIYLRMVAPGYMFMAFSQLYLSVMKASGYAARSSLYGSIAVVINIILNAVFIFGLLGLPRLEIAGAALATVISNFIVCIICLIFMMSKKGIKLRLSYFFGKNCRRIIHRDFWHYTTPVLFNQLGWGGGVTMYSVIMGHLGSDATAANSIANIVRSMIASLCWGLAAGVSIIIGNMLGCNMLEKAKRTGGRMVRFSIYIGIGSGFVIMALIPLIMHFSTLSDTANVYLKGMLFLASYYIIGNSLNSTIIAGIFPAGGDTKFGMFCDIITLWCFVVPLGLLAAFVFKWPIMVVAFILTLDEFVKIPAVYIHYKKYKWVKNITREKSE